MKRLMIFMMVMFGILVSGSVLGAGCSEGISDGCIFNQSINMTSDATFNVTNGIIISGVGLVWDCKGYSLYGNASTTRMFYLSDSFSNLIEIRNCNIQDVQAGLWVNSLSSSSVSNITVKSSTINNAVYGAYFEKNNDNKIMDSGFDNVTVSNFTYGIYDGGSQTSANDFVLNLKIYNSRFYNGVLGVKQGATLFPFPYGYTDRTNYGGLGWIVDNTEFHDVDTAILVAYGKKAYLMNITNSTFNNSLLNYMIIGDDLIYRADNTYTNSNGNDECFYPDGNRKMVVRDATFCAGDYFLNQSIYLDNDISITCNNGNWYPNSSYANNYPVFEVYYPRTDWGIVNVEIENCNLNDFYQGIYLYNTGSAFWQFIDIRHNIFHDITYPIDFEAVEDGFDSARILYGKIHNNTFTNSTRAITFLASTESEDNTNYGFYGWNITDNTFIDNGYGIWEQHVRTKLTGNVPMQVINNDFYNTSNRVYHSSWKWFNNVAYGNSRIQDNNLCQYPDLLSHLDAEVSFCSGSYMMNHTLYPYSNVIVYCDGTVLYPNVHHSTNAFDFETSRISTDGIVTRKPYSSSTNWIEGCVVEGYGTAFDLSGSTAGINSNYNWIYNNNISDNVYGIRASSGDTQTSDAWNENIYKNLFYNNTFGIYVQDANTGHDSYGWWMANNTFNDNNYGIYYQGSITGTDVEDHQITENVFTQNNYHIYFTKPSLSGSYPQNITAHYNVFSRDFSGFAVYNFNNIDQDFTLNNWGTGYSGVIDTMIYDKDDNVNAGTIYYVPIIGYAYIVGTPILVFESWESALATDSDDLSAVPVTYARSGYSESYTFTGNNKWYNARYSSQTIGNVYLSNDAVCYDTYCYKADVYSTNNQRQYSRLTYLSDRTFNMTSDSIIEFSARMDSGYWQSGGALLFRDENDNVMIQIDFGMVNETYYTNATSGLRCSITDLTAVARAGTNPNTWYDYSFVAGDLSVCYADWQTRVKNLDRVEFVLGGREQGTIGNILWYIDNINIEDVIMSEFPAQELPEDAIVLFQEPFYNSGGWVSSLDDSNCVYSFQGADSTELFDPAYGRLIPPSGNEWGCWSNSSVTDYTFYPQEDQTYIATPQGVRQDIGGSDYYWTGLGSTKNWSIDARGDGIHFMLTCDTSNLTNVYPFLFFSPVTSFGGYPTSQLGMISLRDGGCAYNSTNPYSETTSADNCCELSLIAGTDCSSGKTSIDVTYDEIVDSCEGTGVGSTTFEDIDMIQFMAYHTGALKETWHFDDLYIYSTGVIGNNSLPDLISFLCSPSTVGVDEATSCGWQIYDDDDGSNETYTAFDCNDDGVLEYGWDLRGGTGSFSCSYSTEGTKTARIWYTDYFHYPDYNRSGTSNVDVLSDEGTPSGGDCIGFIPPTCTGDCHIFDDFNYNNPVLCNGWTGTGELLNPIDNELRIQYTNPSVYDLEIENGAIYESMWDNFVIEFDIKNSDTSNKQFTVFNNEFTKYSIFMIIDTYQVKVYSPVTSTTIFTMTPDQNYHFKIFVDLVDDDISYYIDDDLKYQIAFYDGAQESARYFKWYWEYIDSAFVLDNFEITYGDMSANATPPSEVTDYTYNPSLFCAINWTAPTGERFKEEYCEMRGYSTEYPLISLCVPRACVSDTMSAIFLWATKNIFITIVIVTAFILVAPLLIRRR